MQLEKCIMRKTKKKSFREILVHNQHFALWFVNRFSGMSLAANW